MSKRKAVFTDGRGAVYIQEEPIPDPGPGEILVRVRCSLISPGTELRGVKERRIQPEPNAKPRAFGYQNSGNIVKTGPGCHERFRVGQRVACMGNAYALHATHGCVPQNLCFPIPDEISYEEAAFNHLAATALQALRRADPVLGENLLVMGLGLIGQLTAQLAAVNGCRVAGADKVEGRRRAAAGLGIALALDPRDDDFARKIDSFCRGYGIDAGFICFGGDASTALRQIVATMKTAPDTHRMGRVVIVGGASISQQFPTPLGNLDIRSAARTGPGYHDKAWERGADYPPVLVQWNTRRNVEEVLRLIAEKRLRVTPLITQRFPLEKAAEACDILIENPDAALGVILQCE